MVDYQCFNILFNNVILNNSFLMKKSVNIFVL